MKKIVRIREEKWGGYVLALYDLEERGYTGRGDVLILAGEDKVVAKQIQAALGEFESEPFVVGIMDDLRALCVRYGIAVNLKKWRVYRVPQR
jgi:hypothetical protein